MRVISLILFALFLAKLLSLVYFAFKSKDYSTLSPMNDTDTKPTSEKVFLDEAKNDDIIPAERTETDEIIDQINSGSADGILDEPVYYDDDTVDDDVDDQDAQDIDDDDNQVNSDLVLQADQKIDEKTTERELEQEKKTPEPKAKSKPVKAVEKAAPKQIVKRLVEGVDFVMEDGVIVATDENFQDLVRHFKYTFIDFYAEWCGWCRKLEPEFAKAAKIMKKLNPDVGFIKINLTRNRLIKKAYKISRFPTVVLFNRMVKKTTTFKYDRTPLVMAKWIQRTLKEQGSIPK